MQLGKRWLTVIMLGGVALAGCGETTSSEAAGESPATLEAVKGTDLSRVVVTEKAAERLGIEMVPVREGTGGAATRVIPYASVVYDPSGATWVYTSPESLTFVRTPVTVEDVDGDEAVISDGPETGTEIVTVGTAELYGTEQEIGS